MTENHQKTHIIPYKVYALVLLALLAMTFISVGVTRIELGALTVTVALLLATIKSSLVLIYFMHLKFDRKLLAALVAGVLILIGVVIFVTFLDYLYR